MTSNIRDHEGELKEKFYNEEILLHLFYDMILESKNVDFLYKCQEGKGKVNCNLFAWLDKRDPGAIDYNSELSSWDLICCGKETCLQLSLHWSDGPIFCTFLFYIKLNFPPLMPDK